MYNPLKKSDSKDSNNPGTTQFMSSGISEIDFSRTYNKKVISSFRLRLLLLKFIGSFIILYTLYGPLFFILKELTRILSLALNIQVLYNFGFYFIFFFIVLLLLITFMIFTVNLKLQPLVIFILIIVMIYLETDIIIGILKFNLMLFLFELPTFIKKYEFYFLNNVVKGPKQYNIREIHYIKSTFDSQIRIYSLLFVILTASTFLLIYLFSFVKIDSGGINSNVIPFILVTISLISLYFSPKYLYTLKMRALKKSNEKQT